jgi:4-amino-4-deoxy-L-arabinose transferase-like glycosyltransferase
VEQTEERLGRSRVVLAIVLAVSFLLRLGYVLYVKMPRVVLDAIQWDLSARRLLTQGYYAYSQGPIAAHSNAFMMPGYPLMLAGIYRIVGLGPTRLMWVRLAQVVLSTLTVLLIYLIAARLTESRKAGLLAGALAAIYPPFILANGLILSEVLNTAVFVLAIWLVFVAAERRSWWWFALVGIAMGLAVLVRPVSAPLIVAVPVYLAFKKGYDWRRIAWSSALVALGFVLVLTPWWIRNYTVYHKFVPLTTISANPLLVSTYPSIPLTRREQAQMWPPAVAGDDLKANAYQTQLALTRLREQLSTDPIGLLGLRLWRTKSAVLASYAPIGTAVARLGNYFHMLLVATMLLAPILFWRRPEVWFALSIPVFFVLVHAVMLIFPRYLFPAMPLVIALAACGIWGLGERVLRAVRPSSRPIQDGISS